MGRSQFAYQSGVKLDDIDLDIENPRIRNAKNQNDCMERVLRKEEQMLHLIKSIAKDGLSTMPILIAPNTSTSKWVVKDGNRRIAGLKLLNKPELCLNPNLRSQITQIRNDHIHNISNSVDCLSSDVPEAIINEVIQRHSGAMGGAGQLNWSPYLRTIFLLNNEHPAEYKRAGQYLFWAEEHNIFVDDDFPITNVSRFFNSENLMLLGFKIEDDQLVQVLTTELITKMANIVINDFDSGRKQVTDVFTPALAADYLKDVRGTVGIIEVPPNPSSTDSSQEQQDPTSESPGSTTEETDSEDPAQPRTRSTRPTKPHWDRTKIFWKAAPSPYIPVSEIKAATAIYELDKLNVKTTPLAAFMLLRALIELSQNYYRGKHGIPDKTKLAKNVNACAESMFSKQDISQSQLDLIKAYSNTDKNEIGIFNIDNLQKLVHRDTHLPNSQTLNIFWDEISPFIRACWK